MFDFYNSDWFNISLEILFLLFIGYDLRRYVQTRKREYIVNVLLTFGFFIWAFIPFYHKYFTWNDSAKNELLQTCTQEHNSSYCTCIDDKVFKEYSFDSYQQVDYKKDEDFLEFIQEAKEECRE